MLSYWGSLATQHCPVIVSLESLSAPLPSELRLLSIQSLRCTFSRIGPFCTDDQLCLHPCSFPELQTDLLLYRTFHTDVPQISNQLWFRAILPFPINQVLVRSPPCFWAHIQVPQASCVNTLKAFSFSTSRECWNAAPPRHAYHLLAFISIVTNAHTQALLTLQLDYCSTILACTCALAF